MSGDVLFEPCGFRNLTVKNRILRSNVSGRFDNYDGSGTQARINWEEKFARGGVGERSSPPTRRCTSASGSCRTARRSSGDERIPFWRRVGDAVHRHDCRFILSGVYTFRNYLLARYCLLRPLFGLLWNRTMRRLEVEGRNAGDAHAIKRAVSIPVLCTGGFQTASVIRKLIEQGRCDAVTIARPLIANNDLVGTSPRVATGPSGPAPTATGAW